MYIDISIGFGVCHGQVWAVGISAVAAVLRVKGNAAVGFPCKNSVAIRGLPGKSP